jgi:uncharacterized hydrophobic protein (TIGR00271 family)
MAPVAEAGIVHLRLVVPQGRTTGVLDALGNSPAVFNIVRLPGASVKPAGDLVLCDVAREEVSVVVDALCGLGLDNEGSIAIEPVESTISAAAQQAVRAAAGSPADAVIWEEVEARTSESAELSFSFLAFMILAMLIAAVGILTDSQILIIGAMVVGPEFGPLAGLCVALIQHRGKLAARSATALAVGFPAGIVATFVFVLLLRAADVAPNAIAAQQRPATFFIAHPNTYSILVAVFAGVAGMLSLTTAKSGALLGVLISVTTIPAAANVGAAAAYANWSEFRGALAQLSLNLGCIVVAGVATLAAQRAFFARRLHRAAG